MRVIKDGQVRFRSRWGAYGYWGITGALWLVLKAGGIALLIALGIVGTLGVIALIMATGGILAFLLGAAAIIWVAGWLTGLGVGIVRAMRSRAHTQADDDNVVPIEHAPRRRFRP